MVRAENDAVDNPVPTAERGVHARQQHAPEQHLLADHRVEQRHQEEQSVEPPRAFERTACGRGEELRHAELGRFGEEGEDGEPRAVDGWRDQEDRQREQRHQQNEPQPEPRIGPTCARTDGWTEPEAFAKNRPRQARDLAPDEQDHQNALPGEPDGDQQEARRAGDAGRGIDRAVEQRIEYPAECSHRQGSRGPRAGDPADQYWGNVEGEDVCSIGRIWVLAKLRHTLRGQST